ncbi:hypothetical protein D2Q93_04570 [Alicyclobacillaceae bacterium I2511]|jgi:hypothetical protein|nr:hypothetical protein D2Q93_04570 [Alicyclobacillaceae bacterium I2511]
MKRTTLGITCVAITTLLAGCGIPQPNNNNTSAKTLPANLTTATKTAVAKQSPKTFKLTKNNWIQIHMINASIGWGVVYTPNQVWETTNGGHTWEPVWS